ncbi:glycoside hydrolase family 16 protein [Joostella atrarenae]|uniref:Glycoside hydrolase family 16 protein n=1 Tax=Joostella atrarenae TaxID=679257 RepID=A0ABS9IYN3_9FLAO|nr:glycoside hydrolase family 16 protein [Joostella atrarenae]MCF8713291.1 glycoside hydrolase family 16 protein [Joostella atrarenae]
MKLLTLFSISMLFFSCSEDSNAQDLNPSLDDNLVWEENFNGSSLNESDWNIELGNGCPNNCGWGNNERQIYTENNHKVKDGHLIITAIKNEDTYTSTRITTKDKHEFQYGTIEARAKLPIGQGIWPAFWMLGANINEVGWPKCGEIDILEYVGKEPETVYTTIHTTDTHGANASSQKTTFKNIEDGFHIFKAEWTPNSIKFFVDEQLVYTYSPENKTEDNWPFNKPQFIIVNMAVGGNFGGPEVDDTIFPLQYIVDYIKVYKN